MTDEHHFICKYCHRPFVREKAYLEHKCKQMKRMEEFQTPTGQAAWLYYQTWFRAMKKLPPRAEAFLTSQYFRTFMTIVQFFNRVNIPTPERFIKLMVLKDFPPTMWMLDEAYAIYMEFLEHKTSPLEQVQTTIDTLFRVADSNNTDVSKVFDVLHPSDLMQLLRQRQVSPWLLLLSVKFKRFFIERCTTEQRIIIETLIQPDSWEERFSTNKTAVTNIKHCVRELGL